MLYLCGLSGIWSWVQVPYAPFFDKSRKYEKSLVFAGFFDVRNMIEGYKIYTKIIFFLKKLSTIVHEMITKKKSH